MVYFKKHFLFVLIFHIIFASYLSIAKEIYSNPIEEQNSRSISIQPWERALKSASHFLGKKVHSFRTKLADMMTEDDEIENLMQTRRKGRFEETYQSGTDADKIKNHFERPTTSSNNVEYSQELLREGVFGGVMRYMGLDSKRMGILALNILIFFAEMITSSLMGKESNSIIPDARTIKSNLFEWFIKGHNQQVDKMLREASDEALPEHLIQFLESKSGHSTACVQLLMCKISPVITNVQKSLKSGIDFGSIISLSEKWFNKNNKIKTDFVMDILYKQIPSKKEFILNGDKCEKRFPSCQLLKLTKDRSVKINK